MNPWWKIEDMGMISGEALKQKGGLVKLVGANELALATCVVALTLVEVV